ncbi:flagellar biosynthesis protein FlgF [Maricaulis sp. W15]|uniref:flagellar hook-basal body complex protein n=1 Tax=Maricaulis sp. W15 TaxID=1772333 RepID=UPI000948FCEB|nr:flagellar hook-basal body complex protein [Maricaulis sp. W15]OLF74162.1 flagellar biosynthesis protein FlgF [Maricaulis sp. W15]
MDNAMMIGLSRQMTLRRSMDVVANNIANANTAGFKVESLLLENRAAPTAEHADGPSDIQFVNTWGMARDFRQGELAFTGREFDLAIEGEGFFAVEANGNEQYTRDGRFRLDGAGQLVASDGAPVLDADTRGPILIDASAGDIQVIDGGMIMQNGQQIGRIGVFEIANRAEMSKQGNGRYTIPESDDPADAPLAMLEPSINQGFVEQSNVQSILELTDMMAVMRSYQSVSKFLEQAEDLNKRAIERLGRI